ncbi:hypothetical protein BHE90_016588 [Fusarium euwallaceae]|uniref:Aminoglycoside phosphotransferase domain-containing protein n=1 Tax=Fusarium euwallaceae TaxID=1147111 RepID=A0A430KZZ7_9HYPO|nr:hypothetical protein BHE90_016588 [Fusarium euwallaceae]
MDEKVEAELATMRYVSAKTTIPVPKVHAYSFSHGSPVGTAFIIMEYIEGQSLQELGFRKVADFDATYYKPTRLTKSLYDQLADVYLQLRQLEFPSVGALGVQNPDGIPLHTRNPDEIQVLHRPLSIEVALQEFEGLDPGAKLPPKTTFSTARDFAEFLLWLSDNELEKSPDMLMDQWGGRNILYARHYFRRFILDTWLDSNANEGPFVLMHGDILQHPNNLLFNKNVQLVGVLDWEFSYVMPAQFVVPPLWLNGMELKLLAHRPKWHSQEVKPLIASVKDREASLRMLPRLSQEWVKMELEMPFQTGIAVALLNPGAIHDIFWWYLFYHNTHLKYPEGDFEPFYKENIRPLLERFMQESPERQSFLQRKQAEQLQFFKDEKSYFKRERERRLIEE